MLCNYSHGVELFQLERKNKSLWPIEAKDLWNNEYEPTNSKHVHNDHQTKGHCGVNEKLTIHRCSVDESGTKLQQIYTATPFIMTKTYNIELKVHRKSSK